MGQQREPQREPQKEQAMGCLLASLLGWQMEQRRVGELGILEGLKE